jgi:hypothetical protein
MIGDQEKVGAGGQHRQCDFANHWNLGSACLLRVNILG